MWLLLLEAALALALLIFIVMWTMWPKRKELRRSSPDTEAAQAARQIAAPDDKPDDKV